MSNVKKCQISNVECQICRGIDKVSNSLGTMVPNGTIVPKCSKKVPILPPSPKFLILHSDAAEKRHIAVGHCCALFRHCIYTMYHLHVFHTVRPSHT